MRVLGLSSGLLVNMHDSAAVMVEDGKILGAAEEERFSRAKHGRGELPERAARWLIEEHGEPDMFAYHCNGAPWMVPRIHDWGMRKLGTPHKCGVRLFNHHECHAASAFYPSPFEAANILTMDNSGDQLSTTLSYGHGDVIHKIDEYPYPQSLGLFYSLVTDHLGYNYDADEYHVMGMAAHGDPDVYYDRLSAVLLPMLGNYRFEPEYVQQWEGCKRGHQERIVSDKWVEEFGPRRRGEFTQDHMDFAAAAQLLFSQAITELAERMYHITGIKNFVLAGGCAMNCRANQHLRGALEFVDDVWVQPASSDAGAALGAALLVDRKRVEMTHAYLGPDIGSIGYEGVTDAARRLCGGEVIGWAHGRMEFGPRALGNRSILALPTEESKKRIGDIKGREPFRPFAPVVPIEDVEGWFSGGTWSMTQTFIAHDQTKKDAPGIVHEDGTARVQTVSGSQNPALHFLLKIVGDETGCPILINTSFNVRGQPIVRTADEAIATYCTTDLDSLYVGGQSMHKKMTQDDIDEVNLAGAGFSGRP